MSEVLLLSPGTCAGPAGRRINHFSYEEISAELKRVWVSHRTKFKGQFRYERRSECQWYSLSTMMLREAAGVLRAANVNAFTSIIFSLAYTGATRSKMKSGSLQRLPDSVRQAVRFWSCRSGRAGTAGILVARARPVLWPPTKADVVAVESTLVSFRVLMDPFEVRMQFLSLIRKLNASALLSSRSTFT